MNWNSFGIFGYLSVLASSGALALWIFHLKKPARRACQAAFVLAVVAFVLAKINSTTHVNRIQPDLSEQTALFNDQQRAAEEEMLKNRDGEVADVRFAEDKSGEHLDKAGMDDAEIKRLEKLKKAATPPPREKRERGAAAMDDTSLESMIGGGEQAKGVEVEVPGEVDRPPSAIMSEADLLLANRLDYWNLNLAMSFIGLGLIGLFFDYLRRANIYRQATWPLPFPSSWRQTFTALPPVVVRPDPPRRDLKSELSWLVRRGDVFLLLSNDPKAVAALPASFSKGFFRRRPVDVIRVEDEAFTDDFIFDALWFGRACFVVSSKERADRILRRFASMLEERRKFRARVARNVHVVCDLDTPPSGDTRDSFDRLASSIGFSLFLSGGARP